MAKKNTTKKSSVKVNDLRSKKDPKGGGVSLTYSKVEYEYKPQTADGTVPTTTTVKK